MTNFTPPSLDTLPEDIRAEIIAVQEKAGFIPNVFLALARRPDEYRAFFAYHKALMEKEGSLSLAEREMIVVAVSAVNQCHYCVIAHGAILRVRAKDPLIADQVAINYKKANITDRQRAMLDFAVKVTTHSYQINDQDYARLSDHGFDQEAIWDIAMIAGFFNFSNRMANSVEIKPNNEFYSLGR